MVMHQIEALVAAGVKHIVLAVSYRAEMLEAEMKAEADRVSEGGCHGLVYSLTRLSRQCSSRGLSYEIAAVSRVTRYTLSK